MTRAKGSIGWSVGLVAALAFSVVPLTAHADTYSFTCITNNSATDCGIGDGQLTVEVTDAGGGQVAFTFRNAGPSDSSIADVYFDDGTLLGIASITNGPGVSFSQLASPPDLPGGGDAGFTTTAGFSADSDAPTQPNGVNPGEFVTITFNLINGQEFADTIAALEDGSLAIGIHVQGFAGGGSESFTNNGGVGGEGGFVPLPGTLLLVGIGLVGLVAGPALRRGSGRR